MRHLLFASLFVVFWGAPFAEARSPLLEQETLPCNFQHFVGQHVDDIIAEVKATQRPYRIVDEHGMMTMDHNPNRITIVTRDEGRVIKVSCH